MPWRIISTNLPCFRKAAAPPILYIQQAPVYRSISQMSRVGCPGSSPFANMARLTMPTAASNVNPAPNIFSIRSSTRLLSPQACPPEPVPSDKRMVFFPTSECKIAKLSPETVSFSLTALDIPSRACSRMASTKIKSRFSLSIM